MGGGFGSGRQQAQGPANLWSGYSQTQYQQPRGQLPYAPPSGMMAGPSYGGGFGGHYQQGWPGFGYGGMPQRFGGRMGMPGMGMGAWGNPFSGFSGGYNPYGPGSYSSPGAMGYGGGSGMFGGGGYNMMVNQLAAIPYQQMARSRFSQPYQYIESPQNIQAAQQAQQPRPVNNPMNPASGCYYDSSQDDFICPGQ